VALLYQFLKEKIKKKKKKKAMLISKLDTFQPVIYAGCDSKNPKISMSCAM
jgi:hypothetical protein